MSNFITKEEVKSIAFERSIADALVPDSFITLSEKNHLKPALGEDLFDRLDTDTGLTAYETSLKTLLKNALAFWVKYECLPHITTQLDNSGLKIQDSMYSQNVSSRQLKDFRDATLETARKFFTIARDYMIENQDNLPYWNRGESYDERTSTSGHGIILPRKKKSYKSDPYMP